MSKAAVMVAAPAGYWVHFAIEKDNGKLSFMKMPVLAWGWASGAKILVPLHTDEWPDDRYDHALSLPDGQCLDDDGTWHETVDDWADAVRLDYAESRRPFSGPPQ